MLKLVPNPTEPSPDQDTIEQSAVTRGSGNWGDPAIPKRGWKWADEIDHGEVKMICEMCQYMHIRYEHVMVHDDWPDALGCGCICAGHMADDPPGALERQRRMERTAARGKAQARRAAKKAEQQANPQAILDRIECDLKGWFITSSNNPILWAYDTRAVVFPSKKHRDKWGYMLCQGDDEPIWGKRYFGQCEAAKQAARDHLIRHVVEMLATK
jgi:hypothetical protein